MLEEKKEEQEMKGPAESAISVEIEESSGEQIPAEPEAKETEVEPKTEEGTQAEPEAEAEGTLAEAEAEEGTRAKPGKRKGRRIAVLLFSLVLVGLGTVYGLGVSKYSKCFLQGTFINGVDCSGLEPVAVCNILYGQIQSYELEVSGRNPQKPEESVVLGTIVSEDIELRRKDTEVLVGEVFAKQDAFRWYEMLLGDARKYEFEQDIVFETERLEEVLESWAVCGEEGTTAPRDARISDYLPQENAYRILPEEPGTRLDPRKITQLIQKSLYALDSKVDIDVTDCYKSAGVTADDPALKETVDTLNVWLGAEIKYNWYGTEITVGSRELQKWVSIEEGEPHLDEEAIAEFVREKAAEADPNGHFYDFKTSLDAIVSLKCITGWSTDCEKEALELAELIRQGAVAEKEPVSSTHNYVQFDGGVGDSYVEVDMTNQHVYLYYKGRLVLESDCVTGDIASGNRTPEGIYALRCRMPDCVLRGPGYESFVSFWMPFYGGYGLHDASWRTVFGGQIYQTNGSHGCVNLPYDAAKTIYSYIRTGFPVICYSYPEGQNFYPEGQNPAENTEENAEELVEENEIHGQY